MVLTDLNKLSKTEATNILQPCCGSAQWLNLLMDKFPFTDEKDLVAKAEKVWYNQCSESDWLQAFTHHPKIGNNKDLAEKFATTQHLAADEQAAVNTASQDIVEQLAKANEAYEKKFGFIFIVCATGKSASEMLRLMQDRIANSYSEELHIAMGEQHKITILRFKKLFDGDSWQTLAASQFTTHVLDTSLGKPGKNITIKLKHLIDGVWQSIAQGITDGDGRLTDLLPTEKIMPAGNYKIVFETGNYFAANNLKGFYPEVEIQFTIFDGSHYHVPLLINPFGYSTYRGS